MGAFLVILGIFLPSYHLDYSAEIPWVGEELEGVVYGHTLPFGWILLFLASLLTVLLLIPRIERNSPARLFVAQAFLGGLTVIFFFTNVLLYLLSSVVGINLTLVFC
jgi:hypothetical protein